MMRRDAPLFVNPAPSWHKYSWMAEFVANISKYEANTIRTVRLAIDARKHMFEIVEQGNPWTSISSGVEFYISIATERASRKG